MKINCINCGVEFQSFRKRNLCKNCSDMHSIQRPYHASHSFFKKLNEAQILHINFWNLMVWNNKKTGCLKGSIKAFCSSKYIGEFLKAYGYNVEVSKKPLEETRSRFIGSMKSFFELRKKGASPPSYCNCISEFIIMYRQNFGKIKTVGKYTYITLPMLGKIKIKLDYDLNFERIKAIAINKSRIFIIFENINKSKPECGIICYDDLKPKDMENKKNMDTGYTIFTKRLLNTAKREGITCIPVNPCGTSKPFEDVPKSEFRNHALSSQLIWRRGGAKPSAISYDFNQRFLAVCEGGDLPDEKRGKFSFPLIYERNEEQIRKLSRSLSRKQKGSKNWKEANRKLANLHRKIMAERKRSQECVIHQLINRAKFHYKTQKKFDDVYKPLIS